MPDANVTSIVNDFKGMMDSQRTIESYFHKFVSFILNKYSTWYELGISIQYQNYKTMKGRPQCLVE